MGGGGGGEGGVETLLSRVVSQQCSSPPSSLLFSSLLFLLFSSLLRFALLRFDLAPLSPFVRSFSTPSTHSESVLCTSASETRKEHCRRRTAVIVPLEPTTLVARAGAVCSPRSGAVVLVASLHATLATAADRRRFKSEPCSHEVVLFLSLLDPLTLLQLSLLLLLQPPLLPLALTLLLHGVVEEDTWTVAPKAEPIMAFQHEHCARRGGSFHVCLRVRSARKVS